MTRPQWAKLKFDKRSASRFREWDLVNHFELRYLGTERWLYIMMRVIWATYVWFYSLHWSCHFNHPLCVFLCCVLLWFGTHDDLIKWKHFPRNWPFVREIHRSPVNFPHKGQWSGALMFSLIYAWINDWVNNREAGDLRRQHGHYDVIVMCLVTHIRLGYVTEILINLPRCQWNNPEYYE